MYKKIVLCLYLAASCILAGAQPAIVSHATFWNCAQGEHTMNSRAGFQSALDAGFDYCEFDLNYTKDGKIVVFHDGAVGGKVFNDRNFSEFSHIRLKNGESIPLFSDFLKIASQYPKSKLIIELKYCKTLSLEAEFAKRCVKELKKHKLYDKDRIIFISFSANICKVLTEIAPGFDVQYISYGKELSQIASLGVSGTDYEYNVVLNHPSLVEECHKKGLKVNVWTCDNEEQMKKLIDLGVDMLTTNKPDVARQIFNSSGTATGGVDLGLSVMWASSNYEANSPTESGSFHDWEDACAISEDGWRLPTEKEYEELMTKCVWRWTELNGCKGFEVIGKNGNSIFIPACGYLAGDKMVAPNKWGYYWSSTRSTLFSDECFGIQIGGGGSYNWYSGSPSYTFPIRLVK